MEVLKYFVNPLLLIVACPLQLSFYGNFLCHCQTSNNGMTCVLLYSLIHIVQLARGEENI